MGTINEKFKVIPAVDVYKGGSVVRLEQGDFVKDKKTYTLGALEIIQKYLEEGALRIHTVDLAGAEAGKRRVIQEDRAIDKIVRAKNR